MIRVTYSVLRWSIVSLLVLLPLANGQREINQQCILTTGKSGQCVSLDGCPEIAELAKKDVLYPWETQRIKAVLTACENDEYSNAPIVCCEPPRSLTTERVRVTTTPTRPSTTTTTTTRRPIPVRITTASTTTMRTTRIPTTPRYDHFKDVLPERCGMDTLTFNVFSSVEDEDNTHVWVVFLEIRRPNRAKTGRCVGTLIHESLVLTAAHCLHTLAVEHLRLFFGVSLISKLEECLDDEECQERKASEFIVHPDYNSHTHLNDIALIRLSEPVDTLNHVLPACLPLDYIFDESRSSDTHVISLGWGVTYGGEMSDSKRMVQLRVISLAECSEQLKESQRFNASMMYSLMCTTGVIAGQDVCQGDSGAPLLQLHENRFFAVGVVTFGPKCGTGSAPGVAIRVSEYVNWILMHMKRIGAG